MATKRKATTPTTEAIDQFLVEFDDPFSRSSARQSVRQYLIELLLPREHNKALTVLASLVPDADRQSLHPFLHDSPWDASALNERRLALWQARSDLAPMRGACSWLTRLATANVTVAPFIRLWRNFRDRRQARAGVIAAVPLGDGRRLGISRDRGLTAHSLT
jgi:hypothetical protein